jgi:hypothetical protein
VPEPGKPTNVPGIGKVDRKWILAGGAAVAGIILFTYWRNSRLPDEELPEEGAEYAAGDQWTPDAYIGASAPGGETYDPNAITENVPGTNAEWSQRVIDALESVGYDRNKAATTVGKYLAGQPLDLTEKLIIQTAIAMLGNPPAGALPIISAPSTPTTPPPSGGGGTTKPPSTPRGDRVNHTQSLESYARHFSTSTSGNSVETTKRQILSLNPWLKAAIYGPSGKPFRTPRPVKAGWIIIVPRGAQR